ncbi:MAG: hypothetical protein H7X80_06705, partial [bacterium]|nr:hypothetical protein [Candidatus Kapabacteria bacterium]
MISILLSRSDGTIRSVDVTTLPKYIGESKRTEQVLWVDLETPTVEEEDLVLAQIFKFHQLAINDVRHEHRRG